MNALKRRAIFARLQAANPTPTTELEYATPFQLLIAVLLSAQSTDKSVNLATRKFFPQFGSPQGLITLGEAGLLPYLQTINLYRTKAKNAVATARRILEDHHGEVPSTRAALEALPGVGRKTANVVLNMVFNHPTLAVDTHIFRVANRTRLAPGKTVLEVEQKLIKFIPKEYLQHAHHWLILHGRYTCVARTPKCPQCNIADLCEYPYKSV